MSTPFTLPRKTAYDTPPHTRAKLDTRRTLATSRDGREEIKRIERNFFTEDVEAFEGPAFTKTMRDAAAKLRGGKP